MHILKWEDVSINKINDWPDQIYFGACASVWGYIPDRILEQGRKDMCKLNMRGGSGRGQCIGALASYIKRL